MFIAVIRYNDGQSNILDGEIVTKDISTEQSFDKLIQYNIDKENRSIHWAVLIEIVSGVTIARYSRTDEDLKQFIKDATMGD